MNANGSVLCLDVGHKRVGVAIASLAARLPRPLLTVTRDDQLIPTLQNVLKAEAVQTVIVGLPRNLQGQSTAQTRATEDFVAELRHQLAVPIETQDEALTSVKAEAELEAQSGTYRRGEVDALAATYILEDWLEEHHTKDEHVAL